MLWSWSENFKWQTCVRQLSLLTHLKVNTNGRLQPLSQTHMKTFLLREAVARQVAAALQAEESGSRHHGVPALFRTSLNLNTLALD